MDKDKRKILRTINPGTTDKELRDLCDEHGFEIGALRTIWKYRCRDFNRKYRF